MVESIWDSMFELSEGVTEDDDTFESMVERMLSTLEQISWRVPEKEQPYQHEVVEPVAGVSREVSEPYGRVSAGLDRTD